MIFEFLLSQREEIESSFGDILKWERLDDARASRIKYENPNFNVFDKEGWDDMATFLVDTMIRFENALRNPIKRIGHKLKNHEV